MGEADRRAVAVAVASEEAAHRLDAAGEPSERGRRRRRVDRGATEVETAAPQRRPIGAIGGGEGNDRRRRLQLTLSR